MSCLLMWFGLLFVFTLIKPLWTLVKWLVAALGKDTGTSLFTWEQSSNISHRTGIRKNTLVHTPACTVVLISTLIDII